MSVITSSPKLHIAKYDRSRSPVAYRKPKVIPTVRKFCEKKNVKQVSNREKCWMPESPEDVKKYDTYAAPKFVDFLNLPDKEDVSLFFGGSLVASKSNIKSEQSNISDKVENDDTLTNSFGNLSLSTVKLDAPQQIWKNLEDEASAKEYVVYTSTPRVNKLQQNPYSPTRNHQKTIPKPFTFDLREKKKQEHKHERINEILEQEKKAREFRANPVPQFIKLRSTSKPINNESSKGINVPEKHVKKSTEEPWTKPLFKPNVSTKPLVRPKTPPLRSTIRARERQKFDENLKEKEKVREEMRKTELAIKEQREREEIAHLRKQLVHKPLPMPVYLSGLRKIEKRPLTDPITPRVLKRRRVC